MRHDEDGALVLAHVQAAVADGDSKRVVELAEIGADAWVFAFVLDAPIQHVLPQLFCHCGVKADAANVHRRRGVC